MEFPLGLSEIYSPRYFTTMCNTCLIRLNFFTYDNAKDVFSKAQTKNFYQKKFLHVLIFFFFRIENANIKHIMCSFWTNLKLTPVRGIGFRKSRDQLDNETDSCSLLKKSPEEANYLKRDLRFENRDTI